jgi:hypothetical protein
MRAEVRRADLPTDVLAALCALILAGVTQVFRRAGA